MSFIPGQDFLHLQDVMGTLPMVKRYIVLSLFFPVPEPIEIPEIKSTVNEALARLSNAYPYLAGNVVYEGRDESRNVSGVPRIVPQASEIQLIVKDYRYGTLFPSFSEISAAGYPMKMLDISKLAPPLATSWAAGPYEVPVPVLVLQANVMHGGVALTFCANHTQMDMTGLGIIIALFATACRGEQFTDAEINEGNRPRGNIVPLLDDDYEPGLELNDVMTKPSKTGAPKPLDSNPRWAYFHFTSSSLARLKSEAGKQDIVPYISTDDAIGALCWQRISAVRSVLSDPDQTSTFTRPISMRKYLKVRGDYIGHLVDCVYTTLSSMHTQSLGTLAGHIRRDLLQESKMIHHTRAFATLLSRLADKTAMANGANLDLNRDLVLSSYANIRCCELQFGDFLGYPEAARRLRMPPTPGISYCMPKDRNGGIAVAVCLAEDELRALEKDKAMRGYAEYIG